MNDKLMHFAKNLEHYRSLKGLRQSDFATHLCTQLTNMVRWEKGQVIPKIDIVMKMAEELKVSMDDLCGIAPPSQDSNLMALAA